VIGLFHLRRQAQAEAMALEEVAEGARNMFVIPPDVGLRRRPPDELRARVQWIRCSRSIWASEPDIA